MINMAMCDDDIVFCQQMIKSVAVIMKADFPDLKYQLKEYHNNIQLSQALENEDFDVIFLDIEIGDENEFEIANSLAQKHRNIKIVFITTHDNLVYDSFEYFPMGFVRKRRFDTEFSGI